MKEFYKEILFLEKEENDLPKLENGKFYAGEVAFLTDGIVQTHIAEIDNDLSFKTGLAINPLARGHVAFRVENLDQFKQHLKTKGINYADWGEKAVSGWNQIFFHDPDGNIVEVHEKI